MADVSSKDLQTNNIWTITFLLIAVTAMMNLDYLIANKEQILEYALPQSQAALRAQRALEDSEVNMPNMQQIKRDSIFKNDLVVTVITGRGSADRRQAIRDSWGKGESDIYRRGQKKIFR